MTARQKDIFILILKNKDLKLHFYFHQNTFLEISMEHKYTEEQRHTW